MSAQPQSSVGLAAPWPIFSRTEPNRNVAARRQAKTSTRPMPDARALARQRDIADGLRDRQLIERLQHGDHQALADLYDHHGGTVYSIALSILHDAERAEDVTQDVFLTLWSQSNRFDPSVGRFAPWFYRIARNRSIDMLRKFRREVMPEEPAVFDLMLGTDGSSPLDTILERHDAVRIRQALRDISEDQRRLIELAYFNGMTQRQMADHLDLALGTVKSRVRSGLRRLRVLLEER